MRYPAVLLVCLPVLALAQPDLSSLTAPPRHESLSISPQGTHFAYTERADDREYLVVFKLEGMQGLSRTSMGANTEFQSLEWASEERLLISPARPVMNLSEVSQPTGEIFRIDADGSNFQMLFGIGAGGGMSSSRIRSRERINAAGQVIDLLPEEPNYVIMQTIGYGVDGEHNAAYRMDLRSGRLQELEKSPFRNGMFTTDEQHQVRFIYGSDIDNKSKTYFRSEDDWLLVAEQEGNGPMRPLSLAGEDQRYLVSDLNAEGMQGISLWDPASNERHSLFHHEMVDIDAIFYDPDEQVWAIRYLDHYPEYYYPAPQHPLALLHQELRGQFKGQDVRILDHTEDLSTVVIHLSSPRNPGNYLLMNVPERRFLLNLPSYPDLDPRSLSRMDAIELQARDGTMLRGYLTLPLNQPESQLPLVVNVHGGPFGVQDTWRFNPEVQILAAAGYAVLQVNFRGSGGYGQPFVESGYGEWGGRMQEDVTDAVQWAIKAGIADPARICIYGVSYGGFAALSGVSQEPDLYQCAVGMSGVYDLSLLSEQGDISRSMRGRSFLAEVLNDESQLAERSPVNHAADIKAPVLLIHGERDFRAPIEHALRMRDALEEAGGQVEWIRESAEGHGISSPSNRVAVYQQILDFLDRHIGAD